MTTSPSKGPTIIGLPPHGAAPTVLGQPAKASAATPTAMAVAQPAPQRPTAVVTAMASPPTASTPAAVNPPPKAMAPSTLPGSAPVPAPPAPRKVSASALPGEARKGREHTLAELQGRFTGQPAAVLEQTRAILAGLVPERMTAAAWLALGVDAQQAGAALVTERLQLLEREVLRLTPRHLARLRAILLGQCEAIQDRGLLRRLLPGQQDWPAVQPEVQQLETLLTGGVPHLLTLAGELERLLEKTRRQAATLTAHALAVEMLGDLPADTGALLLSRQGALLTSRALLDEQVLHLTLDVQQVQGLVTQIQTGVLVQLPTVLTQMATFTRHPTDTERFQATEKLTSLLQFLERTP